MSDMRQPPPDGSDNSLLGELDDMRRQFEAWRNDRRGEFWNSAHQDAAKQISLRLEHLIEMMRETR